MPQSPASDTTRPQAWVRGGSSQPEAQAAGPGALGSAARPAAANKSRYDCGGDSDDAAVGSRGGRAESKAPPQRRGAPALPELEDPVREEVDDELQGEEEREAQVELVGHVAPIARPAR